MSLKRLTLHLVGIFLVLAFASSAFGGHRTFLLGGSSGAQLQIGGGLPLPIQLTDANMDLTVDWGAEATAPIVVGVIPGTTMGPGASVFPPLLIKGAGLTVMSTGGGALTLPAGLLFRPAVQTTLGVNAQNPVLHAVATNLGFKWPAASAMLGPRSMTPTFGGGTHTFPSNPTTQLLRTSMIGGASTAKIRYVNPGAGSSPFGGVARFAITPMFGSGVKTTAAVTVFAIAGSPPNCMFGPGCVAAILAARPVGSQAAGGTIEVPVATTAMGVAGKNIYVISNGTPANTPKGTIVGVTPVGVATAVLGTNMATSNGYPWTTGRLTVSAPGAKGTPENFVLSGGDFRALNGVGTIQLVSGSLSQRVTTGPNGNRGWVKLDMQAIAPTLSTWSLVALCGALFAAGLFVASTQRRGNATV